MSNLQEEYERRYQEFLKPTAERLEKFIRESLSTNLRIDRITSRAKSVGRFIQKASKLENGKPRYAQPLSEIQDQIGARVVTYYLSDVPRIAEEIRRYFRPIENKVLVPDSESEFGYFGQHFILLLPSDVLAGATCREPIFFELQIKTLFQHAWSEAEHDLGYKPTTPLTSLQKRKVAFTAAQAWGADQIFDELFLELNPN
jgi:putative GTP pyrophosphokinase